MEALPSVITKLGELLVGEYNLQKEVKGGIKFLQSELKSIQGALEKISGTPADQLDKQDKIWARDVRELAYDIEDKIDIFMVRCKGMKPAKHRGLKKVIDRSLDLLMQPKIRHKVATDIRGIKCHVKVVSERRDRYKVHTINPVTTLDPRIGNLYAKVTELVGINNAKEELVMKLTKGDEISMQKQMIVSIVGFGGLGKTTLAKAVFDEIHSQFDCTAFVTVSQNPSMKKFLKDILYELGQGVYESLDERQLIDITRQFLLDKRYLIIIDDIWNTSHWEMIIKHALPDGNTGCRIITTTRIVAVADHIGHAYEMKPLSPDNSRVLLYRRIFYDEDPAKCLDEKLIEVSDRILKKCAGVPLAIITIASLLASKGRNKTEWDEVYNSIGNGMENTLDAENMRKILSYSYYDLSSNLRTCLLYLSIFPEDFEILKDRLIWLWVGEGFIQHEEQRKKSLFELGESYFNELINRSMIQPISGDSEICGCRVHDMVLDLIRSISTEENFITILSNMDQTSPSTMVRRLSLQNGEIDCAMTRATRSMPFVRSAVVFPSAFDQMPKLRSFKVLRVLNLQYCHLSQGYSLQYLGNLFHLRYLNLECTGIDQLPEALGNLQFLEVLDVANNNIRQLPKCVAQLTHLLCLSVDPDTKVPNGIRNLTSLEQLEWLVIDDEASDNIEGLGLLTELRVLRIMLCTDKWTDKLVESLRQLQKIQRLSIDLSFRDHDLKHTLGGLDAWVPPPQLRSLELQDGLDIGNIWCFSALPSWMNCPTQFRDLAWLTITVRELQQEDLVILGRLPSLYGLFLKVDHEDLGIVGRRFVCCAGLFPCLVNCWLRGFLGPIVFQQGAMPRLRQLFFEFFVSEVREIAGSDGGFDLGIGNLLSLEDITVSVAGVDEDEVYKAIADLRHAAEIHPNQPRHYVQQMKIEMMNRALD